MPEPPYPKNAPGPFYVENQCCLSCDAPYSEAPDLMAHDDGEGGYHCHFRKQPETPQEVERAVMACVVSCVRAVRYAGNDPAILKRFGNSAPKIRVTPRTAEGRYGRTRRESSMAATELEFYFDGMAVGYFVGNDGPRSAGSYRYESYRGPGHYEMYTLREAGAGPSAGITPRANGWSSP